MWNSKTNKMRRNSAEGRAGPWTAAVLPSSSKSSSCAQPRLDNTSPPKDVMNSVVSSSSCDDDDVDLKKIILQTNSFL